MRKQDEVAKLKQEELLAIRTRFMRNIAGLIVTLGGVTLAIIRPEHVYIGMGVAMIGAGFIDATQVINLITRR